MKFFAALKLADFAKSAFAEAGLDLEKAHAANDVSVLKTALAANDPEKILAEAKQENDELATQLAAAKKDLGAVAEGRAAAVALHQSLVSALGGAGLKIEGNSLLDDKGAFDAAKVKAAHEGQITKAAREYLAKQGHAPLDETPISDAAKQGSKPSKTLAEFNALSPLKKRDFAADVRAGKAVLTE